MDRSTFVGESESWWLLGEEAAAEVTERRILLGRAFGWDDQNWFSDQYRLGDLYDLVQHDSDLLDRAERATDSATQVAWIDDVLAARQAATAPAEPEPAAAPAATPGGDTESAVAAGPAAVVAPEPAPPVKKSIFAARHLAEENSGAESESESESSDAQVVGSAPSAAPPVAEAQPHKTSLFARKAAKQADAQPEPPAAGSAGSPAAGSAGAAGSPAPGSAAAAGSTDAPAEPASREAVLETVAAMVDDSDISLSDEEAAALRADSALVEHLRAEEEALEKELQEALSAS